jgi:thiopurine S-methyltransferase
MTVDAGFWQARWDEEKIGFHEGKPNRWLERRIDVIEAGPSSGESSTPRRVLVPMAGKSVDVAWLAGRGHRVVAVELVEKAIQAFFAEAGLEPARDPAGAFDRWEAGGVVFLRGDVFDLEPAVVDAAAGGPLDAIYDRAAHIALDPADRARYVATLMALLPPGGRTLLVGFQHGLESGPPFDLTPDQVRELFALHGEVELLGEDDITADSPNMTARGATRCLEAAYAITRR